MNGITILLWATIFIIGVIAIIIVKLHYRGEELEKDEDSIIPTDTIDGIISYSQEKITNSSPNIQKNPIQSDLNSYDYTVRQTEENLYSSNEDIPEYVIKEVISDNNTYPIEEVENTSKMEYESQNQILINYENKIKKSQKPIIENQADIMTPDNEKHELKDLFTIDELIKESKRKDSEREKEAQQIKREEDEDLTELKESIKKRQENDDVEEKLIEEILADEEISELLNSDGDEPKEETIQDIIDAEEAKKETIEDVIDANESKEETIQDIIDAEEAKKETIQDVIDADESKEETIPETIDSDETTKETESIEETVQEVLDIPETFEEETIQDVLDVEEPKEETIEEIIKEPEEGSTVQTEIETPSQKDIAEVINNASQEIDNEEIEPISESENITDVLLNSKEEEEEIKKPALKSPTKINETKDDFGAPIDDSNLFEDTTEEMNDLDYRKDLAKITNTIKGSKLFQDVKDRLRPEPEPEIEEDPLADIQESYIRNVNEFEEDYYDEYAPIINETHEDNIEGFGEYYEPDYDQAIREENTRRLFNNVKSTPEPEIAKPKVETIRQKHSRDNIKIQLNNTEVVLKKGDEIIFKHDGETYSSQVYAINGDDISVRYRRKDIKIKPEDVKKIY